MRKSFLIMVLMLAMSVGLVYVAHGRVEQDKERVAINETVLYGDKAAAEGITIDCSAYCANHLFWDTHYTVGEEPVTHTDFTFSQAEKRQSNNYPYPGIVIYGNYGGYGINSTGGISMEEQTTPVQAVASRTAPGEEHKETVYMKDFYDYYPIYVDARQSDIVNVLSEDKQKTFSDYFKFPVYPAHQLEISVTKDAAGSVHSISVTDLNGVYLVSESVLTDSGCFFILSCRTSNDGSLLDTSQIAGGYGIYYVPYDEDNNTIDLAVEQVDMVFGVDAEQAEIVSLRASTDKKTLLLLTRENEAYMLTVIDAATMTQRQKLKLLSTPEAESFGPMFIYDDFIVPVISGGRFAVVAVTSSGDYELRFTGQAEVLQFDLSIGTVMDFDGERLAITEFLSRYDTCDFYLDVFDKTGLIYSGKYDNSLDNGPFADSVYRCRPVESNPLRITWGSSIV